MFTSPSPEDVRKGRPGDTGTADPKEAAIAIAIVVVADEAASSREAAASRTGAARTYSAAASSGSKVTLMYWSGLMAQEAMALTPSAESASIRLV